MRIIITEEQFDKHQQKILNAVKKYGFLETVRMLGINKIKLAQLTNSPIKGDTFFDNNEIVVGHLLKDLVNMDNDYKVCKLEYDKREVLITWYCKFEDDDISYASTSYSTPYYYDNDSTPIDTLQIEAYKDGELIKERGSYYEYSDKLKSPIEFENVDKLIDWFNNVYKPETYKIIKEHVKKFRKAVKL
jgi:hypothetical protein